jgi:intein/homing endonuclease
MTQPRAYYNENDKYAAAWIKKLIAQGLVAPGDVDERSIEDVQPSDLIGYTQCHFFAGIAGWSASLRRAGWSDSRPCWTASLPCFPGGTLVMTSGGYKPIESVAVGDDVLTHAGRFMPVTHTGSQVSECVTVKGQGHFGLDCTPDHPFYCDDGESVGWVPASELKGKRWATVALVPPIPMPRPAPKHDGVFFDRNVKRFRAKGEKAGRPVYVGVYETREEAVTARAEAVKSGLVDVRGANGIDASSLGFARFLGYWVGDGWVSGETVFLCGSRDDRAMLEGIFAAAGLPGHARLEKTSSRIQCGSQNLVAWLREHFGEFADGKRIPVWMHGMPDDYRAAFLDGYSTADGSTSRTPAGGILTEFSTVSKALAVGIRVLINQSGKSASIRRVSNTRELRIEGRSVNEQPYYRVSAYDSARSFRLDGRHGWGLVRSVTPAETCRVYNLAVSEDESYTADGIVVHNCQPWSQAGKGEGVEDKRHLWPVFRKLLEACKPQRAFGEQVASSAGREWLARVRLDCQALGYEFGAADLCCPCAGEEGEGWFVRGDTVERERIAIGGPHIRQRLYWWADCGMAESQRDGEPGRTAIESGEGVGAVDIGASTEPGRCSVSGRMADTDGGQPGDGGIQRGGQQRLLATGDGVGGMAESKHSARRDADSRSRISERVDAGWEEETDRPRVCGETVRLADLHGTGCEGRPQPDGESQQPGEPAPRRADVGGRGEAGGKSVADGVAHPVSDGLQGRSVRTFGDGGSQQPGHSGLQSVRPWSDFIVIPCTDGKARRAQPGAFPLASSVPSRSADPRMGWLLARLGELGHDPKASRGILREARANRTGRLRGYGNSIALEVAAMFVKSCMEVIDMQSSEIPSEVPVPEESPVTLGWNQRFLFDDDVMEGVKCRPPLKIKESATRTTSKPSGTPAGP